MKNSVCTMLVVAVFIMMLPLSNCKSDDINKIIRQGYIPPKGFVPDEAAAIKIAEAIWFPIYGAKIKDEKPFIVELKDSTVWIVQGTLKEAKGGVAYIEIQKNDCKILIVTHGK